MITAFENYSETDDPDGVYLPSPERIRRLSAAIRRGWSDREFVKRSASRPKRWTVSEVSVSLDESDFRDD